MHPLRDLSCCPRKLLNRSELCGCTTSNTAQSTFARILYKTKRPAPARPETRDPAAAQVVIEEGPPGPPGPAGRDGVDGKPGAPGAPRCLPTRTRISIRTRTNPNNSQRRNPRIDRGVEIIGGVVGRIDILVENKEGRLTVRDLM
jgi:hypothetical protein